ncbi:hypothetical protein DFH09DRAFT_1105919 [Mycena vulgaris]|nr:hypothetical protein DFH09DRAFT_1105919 [Mycena vulgaris]
MNVSTTSPTPAQELAALVTKVAALSKLALEMTKLTMDIDGMACPTLSFPADFCLEAIPTVIASQVAAAVAAVQPPAPQFVEGVAYTPTQMDGMFPPGFGDHQAWYVVIVGREPGLYGSSVAADAEVNGVPGQFRQKKSSRIEALAFYRNRYNDNAVIKLNEAVVAAPAPAPVAAASTAAPTQ